ncbi:hypothetical protein MMC14_004612 [Varicellaria rhodocarpa]|nr:hypothetical protein [Varicellaria rhodocarpa]
MSTTPIIIIKGELAFPDLTTTIIKGEPVSPDLTTTTTTIKGEPVSPTTATATTLQTQFLSLQHNYDWQQDLATRRGHELVALHAELDRVRLALTDHLRTHTCVPAGGDGEGEGGEESAGGAREGGACSQEGGERPRGLRKERGGEG